MGQQPAGVVPDGFEPDAPASVPPHAPAGAVSRFAAGAWKNLNPMGIVSAVEHPQDTAKALLAAHQAQYDKAKDAYSQGRYSEAVGHLAAAALPVIGPAAAAAGEKIGAGDIAGGLGEGAGVIGSVFEPRAVPKVVGALKAAPGVVSAGARAAVKAGAAAADYAEAHPMVGAAVGGAVGAAHGGPVGALTGALEGYGGLRGLRVLKAMQKVQRATGKVPPLADIAAEIQKTPEPPAPTDAPAATGKTPKQLNEEAIAARRAQPAGSARGARGPASASVSPESLIDSLQHLDPSDYRPGATVPVGEGVAGDLMRQQSREVDLTRYSMPLSDARHAQLMESFGGTQPAEPVPLSQAVAVVRQIATNVKPTLTAAEFTEATRLAKVAHPPADILAAIQVQRALRSSSSFAKLPTDAEVATEISNRVDNRSPTREESEPAMNPFR